MNDRAAPASSMLCTQCGLCCTGALHDYASADIDEVESLRGHGMIVSTGAETTFSMPCPCLKGMECSIYEKRPRVCVRYQCQLLWEAENGKTEVIDALLKIREARRLFDAVITVMPPGMSILQAMSLSRRRTDRDAETESLDPRLLLQALALTRYLDLHFRHSGERRLLKEQNLTIDQPAQGRRGSDHV